MSLDISNCSFRLAYFLGIKELGKYLESDRVLWFQDIEDDSMFYETLSYKRLNEVFGFRDFCLEFFPDRWVGYLCKLSYTDNDLIEVSLFNSDTDSIKGGEKIC